MLQNFLQRAPGECRKQGLFYTLAQGEMLPDFSRGVFPGVAASDRVFPLVIKGKCCPIFRGAPGERLEAAFLPLRKGKCCPFFLAPPGVSGFPMPAELIPLCA